jgi:phosphate transport system protein
MTRHFHVELKNLRQKLTQMSFLTEEAIAKACDALFGKNARLAEEVLKGEKEINRMEIEVDDLGHSLYALGQPMAVDLRLITMILKINTDLERMGDHAVNIAEGCLRLLEEPKCKETIPLENMARATQKMLRDALNAFLNENVALAQEVLKSDDIIDQYHEENFKLTKLYIERNMAFVGSGLNYVTISHNLERIADLANNIAEAIIYWKQGREVRHHIEIPKDAPA